MEFSRRHFLGTAAGAAGVSIAVGGTRGEAADRRRATIEALDRAAAKPALCLDGLDSPLIIESIDLLKKGNEYFVRARAKGGAEGVSLQLSPGPGGCALVLGF